MTEKISRRDALKLGTSAAVTATVSPLLTSGEGRRGPVACEQRGSNSTDMAPVGENGICFMQARDLAAMIRGQKISSREVMQAHLKQNRAGQSQGECDGDTGSGRPVDGAGFGGR